MRKYNYLYVVQRKSDTGWQDLFLTEHKREADIELSSYKLDGPENSYRQIQRRERKPEIAPELEVSLGANLLRRAGLIPIILMGLVCARMVSA